jgi:hypothetical protein
MHPRQHAPISSIQPATRQATCRRTAPVYLSSESLPCLRRLVLALLPAVMGHMGTGVRVTTPSTVGSAAGTTDGGMSQERSCCEIPALQRGSIHALLHMQRLPRPRLAAGTLKPVQALHGFSISVCLFRPGTATHARFLLLAATYTGTSCCSSSSRCASTPAACSACACCAARRRLSPCPRLQVHSTSGVSSTWWC